MKLLIKKTAEKQIGNVRVSPRIFTKIKTIAGKEKVSMQTVIRAILEHVIDEVEI